jgi:hypothetical protein
VTDPAAYLSTIDLPKLAANLVGLYGGTWDAHRAIQWLVQGESPFLLTKEYGVFYSVEHPATWMEPDELLSVTPTDEVRRYLGPGKAIRSPYKHRHKVA